MQQLGIVGFLAFFLSLSMMVSPVREDTLRAGKSKPLKEYSSAKPLSYRVFVSTILMAYTILSELR
jgi:hypothetical protein